MSFFVIEKAPRSDNGSRKIELVGSRFTLPLAVDLAKAHLQDMPAALIEQGWCVVVENNERQEVWP